MKVNAQRATTLLIALGLAACDSMASGEQTATQCQNHLKRDGVEPFYLNREAIREHPDIEVTEWYCRSSAPECAYENAAHISFVYKDEVFYLATFADSPVAPPARLYCEVRGIDF